MSKPARSVRTAVYQRSQRMRCSAACGVLVVLISGLLLAGCASSGGSQQDTPGNSSPVAFSSRSGLELRRWIVRDQRGYSARLLSTFASAEAFEDPTEARRWQMSGMLVAKIAASDVPVLREQLSGIAQERIEWLGAMPDWVPVHRTAAYGSGTTAWVDSGPMQIDPGSLSVLARAWAVPGLQRTNMRIELMPQIPVRGASGDVFIDGAPLTRQRLGVTLQAGEALLVLPAAASRPDNEQAAQSRPEFEARAQVDAMNIGPPVPEWPTLGELLLVAQDEQRLGVYEQVMVFVAHVPQPARGGVSCDEPVAGQTSEPVSVQGVNSEPAGSRENIRVDEPGQSSNESVSTLPDAPVSQPEPEPVSAQPEPLSTEELLQALLHDPRATEQQVSPTPAPPRRKRGMVLP